MPRFPDRPDSVAGRNDPSTRTGNEPSLIVEPFLHVDEGRISNPLNDRSLGPTDELFYLVAGILKGRRRIPDLSPVQRQRLIQDGWIVADRHDLAHRYRLKYVSLEPSTPCNQACYFCPVSVRPRDDVSMPTALFEDIVRQLANYRNTIVGVALSLYNEPTIDARLLDLIRILKSHGLPPALLTNGTGLTPAVAEALLALGGLRYLSVNLSTMDRERYARDRRRDHVGLVLRHLDYLRNRPVAEEMVIAVLGVGNSEHRSDFQQIADRFAGSLFETKFFRTNDRAGILPLGLSPTTPHRRLHGCDQTGSRPLQHLHVTVNGKAILCCQDYDERYEVGDLTRQTLHEVLSGPDMARLRRWAYGLEEAPGDFLCRQCIFARPGDESESWHLNET